MAEIFGTAAAALGVAALFNNCVDCFEYIQLGRHFGRDYQRCQLKLDVARTRLARWGEAVNVNADLRFATNSPGDQSVRLAQSVLEGIADLFQSASKTSSRYEKTAKPDDLVLYEEKDMTLFFGGQHSRLRDLARRRQKSTSLVKKTMWALYDGKNFERMLDQITSFIDELERLFPVEAVCRRLAEIEVEEVEEEQSLAALKDAADGTDPVLSDAVAQKVQAIAARNYAKDVKTEDYAKVQVGNQVGETAALRGIAVMDQTTNSVETVAAKGNSGILVGNMYGGKTFWDN